jgi:hypothetical protein
MAVTVPETPLTVAVEPSEVPTAPLTVMGFDPPKVCADDRSPKGSSRTLAARTNRLRFRREIRPGSKEKRSGNMASKPHIVEPTAYLEGSVDGMRLERQGISRRRRGSKPDPPYRHASIPAVEQGNVKQQALVSVGIGLFAPILCVSTAFSELAILSLSDRFDYAGRSLCPTDSTTTVCLSPPLAIWSRIARLVTT